MTEAHTLQRGDQVPHFEVTDLSGCVFHYSSIWQHRNLVLIALPGSNPDTYTNDLVVRAPQFRDLNSVCVMTQSAVTGLPAPGALVADRWGEIVHIVAATHVN